MKPGSCQYFAMFIKLLIPATSSWQARGFDLVSTRTILPRHIPKNCQLDLVYLPAGYGPDGQAPQGGCKPFPGHPASHQEGNICFSMCKALVSLFGVGKQLHENRLSPLSAHTKM